MNTKLITGLVIAIVIVGALFYFKKDSAMAPVTENQDQGIPTDEPKEVTYIGFEGAPAVVVAEVQETITKDNATERRISPLEYTEVVRLSSYEKVTWNNDCLVDTPSPESPCKPGTYVGYVIRINVDGDVQEWRFTEDRSLGSIDATPLAEFP